MGWFDFFNFKNKGFTSPSLGSDFQLVGNSSAKWIDVNNGQLWHLYSSVPHLNLVVNKKAAMMSNMVIRHLDKNGEEIENSDFVARLRNPNAVTNGKESIRELSISKSIYSNAFMYQNKITSNEVPVALWNLPPDYMSLLLTGKSLDQVEKSEIIKSYKMDQNGASTGLMANKRNFEPKEIIHIKDNVKTGDAIGTTKLNALQKPISNLVAAYEARNVLINERGAIGIISTESKDGIPMGKKEKKRIQKVMNESHGITSFNGKARNTKIVTTANVRWQQMNFDVKQLALFEEVEDDFRVLCDSFGLLINIFSSQKGTTFENQKEALRSTYQNTIIPEAEELMNQFSNDFGLSDKGERLTADFSHLPILQENEQQHAKALLDTAKAWQIGAQMLQDGAIDQATFDKLFK